ncbi:MAG: hypothetical protein WED07_07530 [Candidatus Freyarchaeum deiterrae]
MKCPICNLNKYEEFDYCENHQSAYLKLMERYNDWKKAINITWQEYLKKIIENENTGEWAREVATHLLDENSKQVPPTNSY